MIELYAAIWRASGRRQIVLILLSLAIAVLAAVPLEFQKDIVNLLTEGALAPADLFLLGAGMMAAILVSLLLKGIAGYRSGVLGEDLIRLIRKRLTDSDGAGRGGPADDTGRGGGERNGGGRNAATARAAVPAGSLATAVSAEAEELGKFAGAAFSEPVVQIGTLISVIGYIAATQPGLGLIALAMIAPQVVLVLGTQRRINALVAERVRLLRRAGGRITGAALHDAAGDIAAEFDAIFEARRRMFLWKLSTKFLLSAINGAGVVGVLMLGGWLVLRGETDVGTVVAATVGLGRIQAPTAFLIAFYRQVSANRVKFELLRGLLDGAETEPTGTGADTGTDTGTGTAPAAPGAAPAKDGRRKGG